MSRHFGYLPQAQWAKERSLEVQEFHWNAMRRGPYYREGELRIPAYVYDPEISPRANEEWKRRRLKWHPLAREWRIAISADHAEEQVQKARRLFNRFWNIQSEQEWKPQEDQRSHGEATA